MARSRIRPLEPFPPARIVRRLYEACASTRLAVVLIAAISVLLAWATLLDSRYGTPAARFGIYDTWWFFTLCALLALNVLSAAAIRFPWKRRQTGFIITHLGILVLLAGCLVSHFQGVESQLGVAEGHSASSAFQDSQHFELTVSRRGAAARRRAETEPIRIPFSAGPFHWGDYSVQPWFPWALVGVDCGILYDRDGITLEVLDYYSDSRRIPVPRIRLLAESASEAAGQPESGATELALAVRDDDDPHAEMQPRQVTPQGPRVIFWMARSKAETEAFLSSRPEGDLGRRGQVVLYAAGKSHHFDAEQLQQEPQSLGDTGLKVQLVPVDPRSDGMAMPAVHLLVERPGRESPRRMVLYARLPHLNRHDDADGVYGAYWLAAPTEEREGEERGRLPRDILADLRSPRVDVLQGHDLRLYYRTWNAPRVESGPWPAGAQEGADPSDPVGASLVAFQQSREPLTLSLESFVPADRPAGEVRPLPFDKDAELTQRRARVRLSVDGSSEEFWLAGSGGGLPQPDQRRVVAGEDRQVEVAMPRDSVDLGFQVFLREFRQRLDAGTRQVAEYTSVVDFLDRGDDNRRLREDVVITLNAPVDFTDPKSGICYRLFQHKCSRPYRPGTPEFSQWVAPGSPRKWIYVSWLSVNYDPGSGLKYAGSMLIIAGIVIVYYFRKQSLKRNGEGSKSKVQGPANK